MAIMKEKNTELDKLKERFRSAAASASKSRKIRLEHEEFYYNDLEQTKSQFTRIQQDTIKRTYNIPVSTKFSYAIIEHLLAFYTASKPFPKYIAAESSTEDFPLLYHKLFTATWYESQGYSQLESMLRDSLNTGDGFLLVRKADFFTESTTNVIIEHKSWKHLIVDPECRKVRNYKDAGYIILIDFMRRKKAEKIYDIKIQASESSFGSAYSLFDMPTGLMQDFIYRDSDSVEKDYYVSIVEFFEKEEVNVYICSNPYENIYGLITNKRPKSIEIPNPEREQLLGQLDELQREIAEQANRRADLEQAQGDAEENIPYTMDTESFQQVSKEYNQQQTEADVEEVDFNEQVQRLQELQQQLYSMPETIPAFEIEVENKAISYYDKKGKKPEMETIVVTEAIRQRKKQVKRTLIVGDKILEREYLPIDEYPIVNLPFAFRDNPNEVYGVIHFILDIVKGMNKYLAQLQLDMSINAHRKFFVWKNTVVEPKQLEDNYASPGAAILLTPDPTLPDGGKPIIIDHAPLNQSFQYMLEYFKTLIEYITGVHGVIQGDSSAAPQTYGATQSLQAFGTNRIKLFSRSLEQTLENLAYIVAKYLQVYCPRDKVITYFDDNGDQQEVQMLDNAEDFRFKVRVDIGSSLPTTRQMTGQQLAFLAQTFSDDTLKTLALKFMLQIQDVPEAKEIAEQMDMIQQMQQQIAQLEEQLKNSENEKTSMQNQMTQKEAAHKVKEAELKAQGQMDVITEQSKTQNDVTKAVRPYSQNNILDQYVYEF